jgi:hypothetical protein
VGRMGVERLGQACYRLPRVRSSIRMMRTRVGLMLSCFAIWPFVQPRLWRLAMRRLRWSFRSFFMERTLTDVELLRRTELAVLVVRDTGLPAPPAIGLRSDEAVPFWTRVR